MKRAMLTALPLLAAGCMPIPGPPPPPYRAIGTEPFWTLLIDDKNLTFVEPGKQPITQPVPAVIHGFAGEIYQSPRISVNIVHATCGDGMSDRKYPDKVQVTVDDRQFDGCGGL